MVNAKKLRHGPGLVPAIHVFDRRGLGKDVDCPATSGGHDECEIESLKLPMPLRIDQPVDALARRLVRIAPSSICGSAPGNRCFGAFAMQMGAP